MSKEDKEDTDEFLSKEYNLEEEHFEIFIDEIEYWKEYYGLKMYEFAPFFENIGNTRAEATVDHDSMIVVIVLNKIWQGTPPTEYAIRRAAYHEIAETLLSKLVDIALVSTRANEAEESTHTVIKILENTHFNDHYNMRFDGLN
jgi:hypothetical protein